MSDVCTLCNVDISEGTGKEKWRRLDGEAMSKVREVLSDLCKEYHLIDDESQSGLYQGYICFTRKKHVEKMPSLFKAAESEKQTILKMLSGCIQSTSGNLQPPPQPVQSSASLATQECIPGPSTCNLTCRVPTTYSK